MIFKYFQLWGDGAASILFNAVFFLISGLYSLPIIFLIEYLNPDLSFKLATIIYFASCVIAGPIFIAKAIPKIYGERNKPD